MFRRIILVTLMVLAAFSMFALAAPKTLTGTVTDTMCGKKHMIAGKTDAVCTRACMKSKGDWTYGLIVGDKIYGLSGDTKAFDVLAGQQVKVTGQVTGTKIAVQTISPAKR